MVTLGVALVLGRAFTLNAQRLRELTRLLSEGHPVELTSDDSQNSEFGDLAAKLAETSRRLVESREAVAAIDASRRELVAWISHDLRTPLASLRAMAEALKDGMAKDPQRFHRQMRVQVDHLSGMVDDLFELSKIPSGTLSLTLEPISVYDLVSEAVLSVQDSGGGIPEHDPPKVFEAGWRSAPARGVGDARGSSGAGWASRSCTASLPLIKAPSQSETLPAAVAST